VAALRASRRHLTAWNALLDRLSARIKIVNPPRTHDLHALKPWEVAVYRGSGLPAPLTVATSDPAVLTDLPGQPRWGWISKGMVGGYGYTETFDPPRDRNDARGRLGSGPLMVQERVEGDNVRAFVLDGRVIGAAEVACQEGEATDSRRGTTRLRRVQLPPEAERTAVEAGKQWGMAFCAVDFMRDAATGSHLLLECNSAPFFVNFEKRSGCDVTSPLAAYLLARNPTGRTGGPVAAPPSPAAR
jgi:ribosomal protein S6--L-glutamate ligase